MSRVVQPHDGPTNEMSLMLLTIWGLWRMAGGVLSDGVGPSASLAGVGSEAEAVPSWGVPVVKPGLGQLVWLGSWICNAVCDKIQTELKSITKIDYENRLWKHRHRHRLLLKESCITWVNAHVVPPTCLKWLCPQESCSGAFCWCDTSLNNCCLFWTLNLNNNHI